MRFPIVKVTFNPPGSWPEAELQHDSIMSQLAKATPDLSIAKYHFHQNPDGTLTPLMRAHEWQLAVLKVSGRKTFNLL